MAHRSARRLARRYAFFALGRRYGADALARWPSFAPSNRARAAPDPEEPALAVIAVRFLYGVRVAGPIVIGASPLPWRRYLLLNAGGALLWSAGWVTLGYLVGAAAERLLGKVARFERELFIGVLIVALAAATIFARRARGRRKGG